MSKYTQYSHVGQYVREHILPDDISVTKAAEKLGVGRVALSNFLNGNASLSEEMAERLQIAFGANPDDLMNRQQEFELRVTVDSTTVKTYVPPFFQVKANEISEWANGIGARSTLAVLIRTLINSTCSKIESINFPGHDDAERRGWDGWVETSQGNPWVPIGQSGWEFSTTEQIDDKAKKDFMKRTASISEEDRHQTTFVFVTPRRWKKKDEWLTEKRAEAKWKEVFAWDSNDLEQWLEQSIPGQMWFANQCDKDFRGVKTLDKCWIEWNADCQPCFKLSVFEEAISTFGEKIKSHLEGPDNRLMRVIADSKEEALAFVYAVFTKDDDLVQYFDKAVVFTKVGPLQDLLHGKPGFLPIVTDAGVEKEIALSGHKLKGFVVDAGTALREKDDITLEHLSGHAFHSALSKMGLNGEQIARLHRESGKSLTVLRRRLAKSPSIRQPLWSSDQRTAKLLFSLMLAGAWKTDNDADQYLINELVAGDLDFDIEDHFNELLALEDSPVWSVGGFRGVVSKIDILHSTQQWVTTAILEQFISVAIVVLDERDPSLDLPADQQWAAAMFGKTREISSLMRKEIGESLVLLAIHGKRLWKERLHVNLEHKINQLICDLLQPLTIERLQSQSWALPLYAEAAPDTFLTIFERDLTEDNPVVFQLMQPCNNAMFERSDRVDILSALELLAWNKKWISRVVDILAQLAASEPVDNLYNKPSNSLETIFHLRMPQTALPVEDRIMVFDRLIERHPQVAWNIAIRQFGRLSQVGHYNHKPRWSDDAIGFGGTSNRNEKNRFKEHCIEKCIHWPSHSCSTLTDMVKRATWIPGKMLSQLQVIITDWAETASDEERVQLREEVRISLRRKRSRTQDKNAEKEVVSFAKAVFDLLEPQDVVWRHAWLFREHWVDESRDELEMNDDVNYEQRTNHIHNLRMSAIREVTSASGYSGVLELAFSGNAPFVVGWSLADTLTDDESRLNFLNDVLESGDILNSEQHQSILEGFLRALDTPTTIKLIDQLWSQHNEDIGIRLLCLAKCDGLVWQAVEERGESVSRKYWTRVRPTWNNPPAFEQNYAVSRLLDLKRVEVAFNSALIEIKQIESRLIYRILSELPFHNSQDSTAVNIGVHQIRRAFRVLNDRNSLNQSEMATLEFLYVEMFPFDDPNIQNLEREIEYSPQLFAELISMAFKKEDSKENRSLTENEREFAKKARRVLEVLSRIPGVQGDGSIDEIKLMAWIEQVRVLCASNGQSRLGDEYIGQLLSNAPIGEDEVWPNASIRSVLEKVLNQNVENGFHVGKQNSIGFEEIVDGGRVPRDRAHQYEDWAKVCDYKYPKVAALLRRMSEDNLEYAEWEDNHASIERRVGY